MTSRNNSKGECNMKTVYTEPELEIVEFETEDVITASPLKDDDGLIIIK